jgi:hypothetical protein
MPVDPGTGTRVPPKPKKPAPIRKPDEGTRGLTPKPQPHPVLQQRFNFHGSVEDFNRRIEAIDKSHTGRLGYRPSGALAYDVAKSPLKDDDIPALWETPRTKRAASAVNFTKANPVGVLEKQDPFSQTVSQSAELGIPDPLKEDLVEAFEKAKKQGPKILNDFYRANRIELEREIVKGRLPSEIEAQQELKGAIFGPGFFGDPDSPFEIAFRAVEQIMSSLTVGPTVLAYQQVKGLKQSVEQRSPAPLAKANYQLGEAAVKGFAADAKAVKDRDWEYIAANPGYIALDFLGLTSAVGKVGMIGRTMKTTKTLRKGNVEVEALRSENPAAAFVQDKVRDARQKRADRTHDTEQIVESSKLGHFARKNLGFERKVGRELERARKLEIGLNDMIRQDLQRVTGWSERAAVVKSKVGIRKHRGLTRGEQMAILVESLDIPGTWHDRAAALYDAHVKWRDEKMGDPAAHEQKLRDIKLAVAAMKKPSKRFEEALGLARQASDEMTAMKVRDLGLNADTASGRVAAAGRVVRTGELRKSGLDELTKYATERQRAESFYVPIVSPAHSKPLAKNPFRGSRLGPYGAATPNLDRLVPELSHEFTGAAFQAGDYRIDTTRLLGEAVGKTVRAGSIISQWRTLQKAATDKPRSEFDRPIRTKEGIPDELRAIVNRTDEGELVGDEVGALSKQDHDEMLKALFPGQQMRDGRWMVDKDIEGVKWVDERLIDPEAWTQPMPSAFVKGADLVNSPFRFATLYLRPAYLLNLLGAAGAAGIYQGYHAPPNVARALYAEKIYGPKVTHTMRELFGGGRNISYVKDRPVSNTTKRVAKGWNTITDERLRMSTGIYYGKKKGVKTREDWEALIEGAAKGDKQAFDTLNEITDRTKKAMVQFDNLTWAEQNILRHAIFIYPWQRGAAVWSIRTLVERPVTSAVLAQIGKDATEDFNDRFTDRVPEWFKNAGYIPLGLDSEGNPKIVNPAGLNTFSTLNSIMHSRVDQLLGPAGEAIVRGVTEKDEFGNEYPSASRAGRWRDAAMDVFMGLPQIAAYKRSQQEKGDKASPDVTDRRSLSGRLDEALAETVLSPGWLDGYGSLITGAALTPRSVNREALLARWYREASPEERAKLQKELVNKALGIQGKLLDRPVALDIRRLVNLQFDLDKRADENQRELGRDITPHERSLLDIGFLAERNLMTGEDVEAAKKQAKRLASEGEHSSFRRELFEEFADPEGRLAEWDESVRRVAALSDTKIVNERLKRLSESGVNDAAVTVPKGTDLKEYARKADAYAREYKDRVLEIAQLRKTDPDQVAAAEAELVAWKSEQDQPVRVNGRVLPSPARMEWAKEWKFDDRKEAVAALASRPWAAMTKFEKALLGKDVDPKIARAYQQLEELKAEYVRSAPIGAKNVPADFELQAAKYLNRTTKGFYGDWLYSKEPLGVRLQTMRPVLESPNRREWQRLFAELQPAVRAYRDVVRDGGVQHFKDSWKEYVNGNMTFSPEFQSELDMFGIDPAEDLF